MLEFVVSFKSYKVVGEDGADVFWNLLLKFFYLRYIRKRQQYGIIELDADEICVDFVLFLFLL